MDRALFGTDGIRGTAGTYPLDKTGAEQIGKAIGAYFAKPGEVILIGSDPRESSDMLVTAVSAGLVAQGIVVENVGVIPTPGLAYLTREREGAKAGVMITASHNPYTDNGIKIFSGSGGKLDDNVETELNKLIMSKIEDRQAGQIVDCTSCLKDYEDFLVHSVGDMTFYGMRIATDSANGATSGVIRRVLKRLSTEPATLFDQPDGKNINDHCGATNTSRLQQLVIQLKMQAGIAFDGDGDRVIMIDEKGRQLTGDHILYILAVSNKFERIVGTVMSNQGLETALQNHGISLERTAVGDRYVLEVLLKDDLKLGGEQSGHIILTDLLSTGDGMLAALQVLKHVQASGKSLAQWHDEIELLPQSLVNITVANKKLLESKEVLDFVEAQTKELGDNGRILIRPSGTEPKARVMVEASDAIERAQKAAEQLEALLKQLGGTA